MDCVVLGNGGMMPMPLRMTTSVLLRREGRMLLFDAGEGIQVSLKRGGLGIRSLDVVAVSHLHADHVLGLPGILMFRAQSEDPGPLVVAGPSGIERFVRHTLEDLRYRIDYELRFVQWSEGSDDLALEWNGCRLLWQPLDHSTACVGYRIEEAARPGRFDTDKARDLGVPQGPLFGRLQAGETVTAADGRRVSPGEVLGPARRGRIVTYATDTLPCPGLERLCSGADLAFVEGMFTSAHEAEAAAKKHMTAAQAGEIAARAGAARLVLLHVSPRYSLADEGTLGAEARARHPRAEVGRQLESYPVLLPE